MKKTLKNQRGITLIALTITIIILLILSAVVITTGKTSIDDSKGKIQQSELNMVQQAIMQKYQKYLLTNDKNNIIGEYLPYQQALAAVSMVDPNIKLRSKNYGSALIEEDKIKYYYKLDAEDLEKIGITGSIDEYMVNYSTGEVFNMTAGKTEKGKVLYTYSK